MALFKIFKGSSTQLGKTSSGTNKADTSKTVEGYCYFTTDDGKFYVDISTGTDLSKRICLNAHKADQWSKVININGLTIDGTNDRTNYGICSTSDSTVTKVVNCAGYVLSPGAEITVKFSVTNSASSPYLNVNSTGAKPIFYRGSAISAGYLAKNRTYTFRYNGTEYELVGDVNTNTTYDIATTSKKGLMSAADKIKLDGIATGAEVNQNAFSNIKINSSTIAADAKTDTVEFVAGNNITLATDTANNKLTITANYSKADTSADGLMSKEDKVKLNNTNIAYGTCDTDAAIAEKVVILNGNTEWTLTNGSLIMVKFANSNTANNVKLNVNETDPYPIWYNNAEYTSNSSAYCGYKNRTITYMFNGTHWVWISSSYDANTQSNTNSTDTDDQIFLVGATTQGSSKTTYSHNEVYVGKDHHVYSNSKQVVNLSDTQKLTNKTYNGYTLGDACAKGVDTTVTSGSTNLITSGAVKTAIEEIVDSAPGALDTLNELAAALGNDENFATTVTNNIATKADKTITISAGNGLTGGGSLSSNRTISANLLSTAKLKNAASAATEIVGKIYPVAMDTNGKLAVNVPWTDTSYLTYIVAGSSKATSNSSTATTNSTTYLTMVNNGTTYTNQVQIQGSGNTSVSAKNGIITISSPIINTSTFITASSNTTFTGTNTFNNSIAFNGAITLSTTNYGTGTPTINNQLYFVEDNGITVPVPSTAQNNYTLKVVNGAPAWAQNIAAGINTTSTSNTTYITGITSSTNTSLYYNNNVKIQNNVLMGAAWNDYAEYRICKDNFKPGQVICENGDDTLSIATERLQPGAEIISDTFGFAIGETAKATCPVAVSGRVLAYTYEPREEFKAGDAVCAGPNGTVSKMTRDEIREYPDRIIGTVSAIPDYEIWNDTVKINNRIWIKVK